MKIQLFVCVALLLGSASASGQEAFDGTPSNGIQLPYSSVAAQDDATSLEINPAGLAFMETGEIGFGFEAPSSDFQEVAPESNAFFFAAGNGIVGTGFSFQDLAQPSGGLVLDDFRKYTWGLALAVPKTLSVGLNVNWFGSGVSERLDSLVSYDLGLQWRLGEHIAFGVMMRDFNQPFLESDTALRRRTLLGLHIRLFDGRLQLDSTSASLSGVDAMEWTPRVLIEPLGGLRIFASVRNVIDNRAGANRFSLQEAWAGLELSFGSFGLAYAPSFVKAADDSYEFSRLHGYHWFSPHKQRSLIDASGRWVTVNLNQSIGEAGYSGGILTSSSRAFLEVVMDLERASTDESVAGVLVVAGDTSLGYAQSWELRQAIQNLRAKGKPVVAYLTQQTSRDYFIASAANRVWVYPTESFDPNDIQARLVSYRGVLNKVGVQAEFMRVGAYKSASEALTHDAPSQESIEQTNAIVAGIQTTLHTAWASDRARSAEQVQQILMGRPLFPIEAREQGLIDAVLYPDELEKQMDAEFPGARLEAGYARPTHRDQNWGTPKEIAIIVVEGNIVSGKSGSGLFGASGTTGSQSIQEVAQELLEDDNVAAVVLRVNSPGGSAVASDQMFRAIQILAKRKPVIASMGDIAASGGYYAAAAAREVYASPLTITGSIGIFTGKFNAASLFDWIGVKSTPVGSGDKTSDMYEPWTANERARVEADMLYRYQTFLTQIASTRALTAEEFDKVARGHVWLGDAALERRIVDRKGGLLDAIRRAEALAGLPSNEAEYKIYPETGITISAGIGVTMSRWLGLSVADDVKTTSALDALVRVLKSSEASAVLPLFHRSEEALMLPYDHLVIE